MLSKKNGVQKYINTQQPNPKQISWNYTNSKEFLFVFLMIIVKVHIGINIPSSYTVTFFTRKTKISL